MSEYAEWVGVIEPPTDEISELRFSLRNMAAALQEMSTTVNRQAQQIRKLEDHQAHSDGWVHKLLNPGCEDDPQ